MSALARWFVHKGKAVAGYDRTSTPLTESLIHEGLSVHFEDDVNAIPPYFNVENTLVVYTPALPNDHKELNYLREQRYTVLKRSQVLGLITGQLFTVAVAGTHGKTTTSSMIAHILKYAGKNFSAFLGGIASNYDSNLILNNSGGNAGMMVVEADEFDRSFLTLHPDIAIVTSVDADHLDIYGDKQYLLDSFKAFIDQIKASGQLFIQERIEDQFDIKNNIHKNIYGINRGQFFASDITIENGFFKFDYFEKELKVEKIRLGVPGYYNIENAVAAIAVCLSLGVAPDEIKPALEAYRGVKRRFEFRIKSPQLVQVDDYAHHPVEIEAFLRSLRDLYPGRKLTVIFQPHLYTRTRDFASGFAQSLSLADEVVLLDIYPAREEPIPGVSSALIFKEVDVQAKMMSSKEELLSKIAALDLEVIATVGAGDIDQLVQPLTDFLKKKYDLAENTY